MTITEYTNKSKRITEGFQLPYNGTLLHGDGCTIDGTHYKCLENCPFEDDCHYDTSNGTVTKRNKKVQA